MSLLEGRGGRVFAYSQPVDMRKGFNGLEAIISQGMGEDPLSGDTFFFLNRRGQLLKCFLWDRTGYVIISKRLEQGRLKCSRQAEKIELDARRLKLLFDGIGVAGFSRTGRNVPKHGPSSAR